MLCYAMPMPSYPTIAGIMNKYPEINNTFLFSFFFVILFYVNNKYDGGWVGLGESREVVPW